MSATVPEFITIYRARPYIGRPTPTQDASMNLGQAVLLRDQPRQIITGNTTSSISFYFSVGLKSC